MGKDRVLNYLVFGGCTASVFANMAAGWRRCLLWGTTSKNHILFVYVSFKIALFETFSAAGNFGSDAIFLRQNKKT